MIARKRSRVSTSSIGSVTRVASLDQACRSIASSCYCHALRRARTAASRIANL